MNSTIDNLTSPTDTRVVGDRNQSPPAFLDLADSVRTSLCVRLYAASLFDLLYPSFLGG